uniref:Uncharacterized protein n=1 Tax=Utricularia reniformis TaxID=192314 RepID=A0A1Y0AZ79_9LAMI|nr:hypothetical protein AEK19_MT0207 [Utricularia reniformis]ART30486.1 hypothetical protein AEK19_MT0207 [Utricularia reniformis]
MNCYGKWSFTLTLLSSLPPITDLSQRIHSKKNRSLDVDTWTATKA